VRTLATYCFTNIEGYKTSLHCGLAKSARVTRLTVSNTIVTHYSGAYMRKQRALKSKTKKRRGKQRGNPPKTVLNAL